MVKNRTGSFVGEQKIETWLEVAARERKQTNNNRSQELRRRGMYLIWEVYTFSYFSVCIEASILNHAHFRTTEPGLRPRQPQSSVCRYLINVFPWGLLPGDRSGSGATFSNLRSAAPFFSTDKLQNPGGFVFNFGFEYHTPCELKLPVPA